MVASTASVFLKIFPRFFQKLVKSFENCADVLYIVSTGTVVRGLLSVYKKNINIYLYVVI